MRYQIRPWCSTCTRPAERLTWCAECGERPNVFVVELFDVPESRCGRSLYRDLAATPEEAESVLAEMLRSVDRGWTPRDATVSLRTFCEQLWLPHIEVTRSTATYVSYRGEMVRHIWPHFGDVRMWELDFRRMVRWLERLKNEGRVDGRGGLAPRTVNYIRQITSRALDHAVHRGFLDHNPCPTRIRSPFGEPAPTTTRTRRPCTWNDRQLERFLEHTADDRLGVAWQLVAHCGLTRGEVLGLRWTDLDLSTANLVVDQAYVTANGHRTFTAATGNARRSIPLDDEMVAALVEHRDRQTAERTAAGRSWEEHELVVCQPNGRPIDPDNFSKTFTRSVESARLPRMRLSDLRALHTVRLLEGGTDPDLVAARLGHADGDYTVRSVLNRLGDAHVAGVPIPDPPTDDDDGDDEHPEREV